MEIDQQLPADLDADRNRRRQRLAVVLVALGVGLRLASYLWNTSFHYDEGWLIQNLQDKSFLELLGPLKNDQAAPVLYLWLLKALYLAGGLNELLLRLPSIVAAVGGMLLLLPLARRTVRPEALLWALVLLAASDNMLIYAARTKPYLIDAAVTTALLYAAVRLRHASPLRYMLPLGILGAGLFWVSYPSCFVYGGAAAMGFVKLTRSRRKLDWLGYVLINLAVGASIFAMLKLVGGQRSELLMRYWGGRAFPLGFAPRDLLKWPLEATYRIFEDAVRPIGYFAMFMSIVGIFALWRDRNRRFVLGLLVAPLALNFLAACLKRYPWVGSRTSIWNIPIIVLLTAEGWAAFVNGVPAGCYRVAAGLKRFAAGRRIAIALENISPQQHRRNAILIGAATVAIPVVIALYYVGWARHRKPHGRALVEYVKASAVEGDIIAVAGSNEFGIYLRKDSPVRVFGGQYDNSGVKYVESVLNRPRLLRRWKRCWLLVRGGDDDWSSTRDEFLSRCPVIERRTAHAAELYLLANPEPTSKPTTRNN